MAIQLSVGVRNARLDAIESTIGMSPILKIRSGAQPASCAAADAGNVLATLNLPSDWLAAASNGSKAKAGTWEDLLADLSGIAGHFRIYASDGTTCHAQGTCGASGSGADMELDNTNIAANQPITITSFALSDGNS